MKHLFLFLFIALISVNGTKKSSPKGVVIEDRPLNWDDFKGKQPSNSPFKAGTYYSIGMESVAKEDKKHAFEITCLFNPKESWVSRKFLKEADEEASAHLLKHEQGHYDLARTIAAELDADMNNFSYDDKRVRYQSDSIYRSKMAKLRNLQILYDKETNHSRVKDEQTKWNVKIEAALALRRFD